MADLTPFHGERTKDKMKPADFLRAFERLMLAQRRDDVDEKIEAFEMYLVTDSVADRWLTKLKEDGHRSLASWARFKIEFATRFKGVLGVVKSPAQLEAELAGMSISEGELAVPTVRVQGTDVHTSVDFANRVEDAASAAGLGSTQMGLYQFRAALPEVLRDNVSELPSDWMAMASELRAIPQSKIASAGRAYTAAKKTNDEVAELRLAVQHLRLAATAPSVAAAGPRTQPAAAAGRAAPAPRPAPTEAQKTQLRAVIAHAHAKKRDDTPEGCAAYEADVRGWERKFGGISARDLRIEEYGYPLTLGIAQVCMDECYGCGMSTLLPHRRGPLCGDRVIPQKESTFRSVCGTWLGARDGFKQTNEVREEVDDVAGDWSPPGFGVSDDNGVCDGDAEVIYAPLAGADAGIVYAAEAARQVPGEDDGRGELADTFDEVSSDGATAGDDGEESWSNWGTDGLEEEERILQGEDEEEAAWRVEMERMAEGAATRAARREACMGAKSCAIPPARQVPNGDTSPLTVANVFDEASWDDGDGDGDENEDWGWYDTFEAMERAALGCVAEEDEDGWEEEEDETHGNANKREASTGATSCAIAPARQPGGALTPKPRSRAP
ncbi:hypothetical protein DFH07DRAFT_780448 [Mycena maculata]|uniref:Uncharacterized protein n=1 Tax=Mycena maculata TaxID=230809 RepID=A0AAD7MV37_9AGAR|nr:hypothetical protein DFH07DRAFT_780448 [Mycena maculata]